MARLAGRRISENRLQVYITNEKLVYLKRLLILKKKELGMGIGDSYPLSRFLRDIISEYIAGKWEILDKMNRAFDQARLGITDIDGVDGDDTC